MRIQELAISWNHYNPRTAPSCNFPIPPDIISCAGSFVKNLKSQTKSERSCHDPIEKQRLPEVHRYAPELKQWRRSCITRLELLTLTKKKIIWIEDLIFKEIRNIMNLLGGISHTLYHLSHYTIFVHICGEHTANFDHGNTHHHHVKHLKTNESS